MADGLYQRLLAEIAAAPRGVKTFIRADFERM